MAVHVMWGMGLGAVVGVAIYALRSGGRIFLYDIKFAGVGVAAFRALTYTLVPGAVGALIGWAVT